jgi:hypothetical protein
MSVSSHGRVKRIHAEFRGDEAVEIDILEVMLRMGDVSRTRIEGDTRLVRLALKALDRVMAEYTNKTGQRYPSYIVLMKYLDELEGSAPAETRVVSLPKSASASKDQG